MSKVPDAINEAAASTDDEIAPPFSEEALALRFAAEHAGELRFVAAWSRWFRWDGIRWKVDDTRETWSRARKVCREAAAGMEGNAKAIASARTRAAVVSLAGEDRRLAATVDQWDADPWLLNTPNGVIDLRTGMRSDHRQQDYMTKVTAVRPDQSCATPLWIEFLECVTNGDKDLQAFMQRICGYALTGSTREHALFFLYGLGGNGKGVFMNTMMGIFGDYHCSAPVETFTESNTDRHPTELAMLRGARIVSAVETEEGRRWAESKIKAITDGDSISARFMRQDFFTFTPNFKLMVSGNHKPGLRSVDEAIRRRLHMVPFAVTIPPDKRDKELGDKLRAEWPGILSWMIDGCLEWQKNGLAPSEAVTKATAEYLKAEDAVLTFMEECCVKDDQQSTSISKLYQKYKDWAVANGEYVGSKKSFSQRLADRGYKSKHTRNGSVIDGLSLYEVEREPPERRKPIWEPPM